MRVKDGLLANLHGAVYSMDLLRAHVPLPTALLPRPAPDHLDTS